MTTAYSTLMGLAEPVQGELSGTWGDTVNKGITEYLDIALAGTQTISGSQTAVTLSLTNGNASATNIAQAGSGATGSAQYALINCTGNPAGLLTITAPASSRQYIVINATSTSQSVKIVGTGPTTGVTIVSGEKAIVAWNGTDYVKVSSSLGTGDVVGPASATDSALVAFDGTTGKLIKQASTVTVAQGGTGQTSYTNGQLLIGNTTGNTLTKATLTAGSGVSITNGNGSITIAATGTGGTVTSVSVASANGFAGTVANATTTPAITLSTSITGVLKGNGTAISAASAGIDYVAPGGALGTPSSGALTNCTADGTNKVGYRNVPPVGTKTSSYTLAVGDVGKYVQVGSGGSITIPDATFAEGDAISIFNNTSGSITITCSITTAYIAGTDGDKATMTLAARGVATVLFISSTVCVVSGNVS